MKKLATGIDTLEIGYEVDQFIDENDLLDMIALKDIANEDRSEIPIKLHGRDFALSYKTPQRYDFYLHNADIQLTISSRFISPRPYPEVHLKFLSPYLWTTGLLKCVETAEEMIKEIFWVTGSKISRADLSVDMGCELPKVERNQFVTRLCSKNEYSVGQLGSDTKFNRYAVGINDSGFTLGMTDIRLRQYPKDFEIELTGKKYFLPIWESAGREGNENVTRTEFQCNRDFLKKWNINKADDLINSTGSLWEYLTNQTVRICEPRNEIRRQYWNTIPFWDEIQKVNFVNYPGLSQSEKTKWNRDRSITMMRGYMLNLQAHGECIENTFKEVYESPEYADDLIRKMSSVSHIN